MSPSKLNSYILLTAKPWHDLLYESLVKRNSETWFRISDKEELTFDKVKNENNELKSEMEAMARKMSKMEQEKRDLAHLNELKMKGI